MDAQVKFTTLVKRALALVAIVFGVATVIAGTRVILGSDPGYKVFAPLLVYNTTMGLVYVIAGAMGLRSSKHGMYAAGLVFALNLLVLGVSAYLYMRGQPIAIETVRAMIFRTGVWLVLTAGFAWVRKKEAA